MNILINPGTGPVENSCVEFAIDNMKHFMVDVNHKNDFEIIRPEKGDYHEQYGDGRYRFIVIDIKTNRFCEVQMPGIELNRVRYIGEEEQDIFEFPRLYLDGSSWIWNIATSLISNILSEGYD